MPIAPRPFRFGVQSRIAVDRASWVDRAQRAEALGYDTFLMPDHFGRQFAIGPALATVAAVTSTIRIGTLVLQNDLRHPTVTAMEAATLDVLSGGRMEIGIGAGGSFAPEFEMVGIPLGPPGERVSRLEECIAILGAFAGPDPVTFEGVHYQLRNYQPLIKPIQQPLPLLIAGGGKRMLTLAARNASIAGILPTLGRDGVYAESEFGLEAFTAKVEFVREAAGHRVDEIEFNVLIRMVGVGKSRKSEIDRLTAEHTIESPTWFDSPMVYVGNVEEICAQLSHVRKATGASYFVVFDTAMEAFAPIVQALRGT